MQDGMMLANLFSSNQIASTGKAGAANIRSVGKNSNASSYDTFSDLFNVNLSTANNSNNPSPERTNHPGGISSQTNDNNTVNSSRIETPPDENPRVSEADAYTMQKEVDELEKEAEDAIIYISSLLGITVENIDAVLSRLLQDTQLISGENADFLNRAAESGANNVLLLKMRNLVELLNKMAVFLADAKSANPEEMVTDELINSLIAERQNEFKGFSSQMSDEAKSAVDFAKVIQMIEEVNTIETALLTAPINTGNETHENADNTQTINGIMSGMSVGVDELQDAEIANMINSALSENPTNAESPITEMAPVSSSDDNAPPVSAATVVLAQPEIIGTAQQAEPDVSENLSRQRNTPNIEPPNSAGSSIGESNIIESMQVKVLTPDSDLSGDERLLDKNTDLSAALKPADSMEVKPQSSNFQNILNVQSSNMMDRAEKIDVIAQIMNKAGALLKSGQNVIKIQLKPDSLGEVFMRVSIESGRVTARVVTESFIAKEAIEANLFQLKESLNLQGIKIDKFNVFVGDKWQQHRGQSNFNYQPGSNGKNGYRQQTGADAIQPDAAAACLPDIEMLSQDSAQINFIA